MRSYINCTCHQILIGWLHNDGETGGARGKQEQKEMLIGLWWVNLKERDRLEEQGLD